ncbi:MAG: hypothetical protein LBK61_11805 [Spirochaetaceae bacterium]|jgi:hypothetical protein|nr:hypothetical protein [Spirochaetaceae bacterium]
MKKIVGFCVVLVFGFVLVACQVNPEPRPDTDPKTISIRNFPGATYAGKTAVLKLYSPQESKFVAAGKDSYINSGTSILIFAMKTDTNYWYGWKGNGEHSMRLAIISSSGTEEKVFYYTKEGSPSTYNIFDNYTSIEFSQFQE